MAGFFFGIIFGVSVVLTFIWLLFYTGGLSREGFARILNGIAIGLIQGKKKRPPEPEPPPAAIPVRLLPHAEVIDIPPPNVQGTGHVPPRPNLLEPDPANHRLGGEPRSGRGTKRGRR